MFQQAVELLEPLGILIESDAIIVAMFAEALNHYLNAVRVAEAEPIASIGGSGGVKLHPARRLAALWWTNVLRVANEIGLTPTSRSRLPACPVDENDPLERYFRIHNS